MSGEWGKQGQEAEFPRQWETEEIAEKISVHYLYIFQSRKGKEAGSNKNKTGNSVEGYRKQEIWTSFPTSRFKAIKIIMITMMMMMMMIQTHEINFDALLLPTEKSISL